MSYKVPFFVTGALLLASIAVHVASTTSPGPPPAFSVDPPAEAPAPSAPSAATASRDVARCKSKLVACEERSWKIVAEAITRHAQRRPVKAAAKGVKPAQPPLDPLCSIAKDHVRRHWHSERANLLASMREVGSEAWVEQDVDKKVAGHVARFSLSKAVSERLEQAYEALWETYAKTMQSRIAGEDYAGLMRTAKDFWRDEDKLVRDLLGHSRSEAYRAADNRARVAILGILAALGELPWDDNTQP